MGKLFIDKNINVSQGNTAEKLIKEKNDSIYIKDNAILSVDRDRWNDAQHYERKTWMEMGLNLSDDRNYDHYERFDSYKSLVGYQNSYKISKIIELGCGPFTNVRTILPLMNNLKEIHLLDPLLNDYLNHTHCKYKNKQMGVFDIKTFSVPIEEFNEDEKYDMVIMNNVLEHCFDINIIFDKIFNMLNKDGLFIFSDVYFIGNDANKMVHEIFDTGHPIKLSENYMNAFLNKFSKIYERDFHGLHDQYWRHDKYFIGIKK